MLEEKRHTGLEPVQETAAPTAPPENAPQKPPAAKERLYDKIPVTVKQLDIFIGVMVALAIALVIYGTLKGRGFL